MEKQLRLWKFYAAFTTAVIVILTLCAFAVDSGRARFSEIDAQRINIVGPDGKIQMVISNRQDMPEGIIDGKTFPSQGRHEGAGLIFYNREGDEDGGLTFGGAKTAKGHAADGGLMFDQYKQDQTVGIVYSEENGQRSAGLRVWDRPNVDLAQEIEHIQAIRALPAGAAKQRAIREFQAEEKSGKLGGLRLFAGKTPNDDAVLVLNDPQGRPRIRLSVSAAGEPTLEFLDAQGKVTERLPRGR